MTRRRWLYVALVVSIIINGLLIGGWLGHRWRGEERMAVHGLSRHILRHEPEELSAPVQHLMATKRGEIRAAFHELKRARRSLAGVIKREPPEPQELEEAFARLRLADATLKTLSHEILIAVLPEMSPAQRTALLSGSRKGHHHGDKHHGGKGKCAGEPPVQ